MTRPTLTRTTVTSTEAGATPRDSPEGVMAEAVVVTMMDQASAVTEGLEEGLAEEPREDGEASGAAEVAILEVVLVEVRATVLVAVAVVDLEEEADPAVVEAVASVEEEGALVETPSVEVEAVDSAEIAIILETTTDPELLVAVADSGALVTTSLAAAEVEPMPLAATRVRRSSSR